MIYVWTFERERTMAAGDQLRENLRKVKDTMASSHVTRLHRAISWLQCAERYAEEDEDLSFVALWISFNSCYAVDDDDPDRTFREDFERFAEKLCALDECERIYNCLWGNFSGFVRLLIDNRYVYGPFWQSRHDGNDDWLKSFEYSRKLAYGALANNNVSLLLSIAMDRLYVLRNQLVHGGATWRGGLNRDQVRDGKRMLMELVPIFIELMFDENEDWGSVFYPVID
jgi:hypothetical protein